MSAAGTGLLLTLGQPIVPDSWLFGPRPSLPFPETPGLIRSPASRGAFLPAESSQ